MTKLLDAPNGVATATRALCHELHRRIGRMFQRNIVIAFEEWRATGTFSLDTFVGELNEAYTPELLAYYDLISAQGCLPPVVPAFSIPKWHATQGAEISTTSTAYTSALSLPFTITEDSILFFMASYQWAADSTNTDAFDAYCATDLNPTYDIATTQAQVMATDEWRSAAGHDIRDTPAGSYSFDFFWKTQNAGVQVRAKQIRLSVFKMGTP